MRRFLIPIFLFLASAPRAQAKTSSSSSGFLELSAGMGADLTQSDGLSAPPNLVTPKDQVTFGVPVDARALIFPFGSGVGLGMDFGVTPHGAPQFTSTDPNLSGLDTYYTSCSSSNAVIAVDVWEHDRFGLSWWKTKTRILGMYALKANCTLQFAGWGHVNYNEDATATSYGGALESMEVFFNFLQIGFEAGYRYYKSGTLVDPQGHAVVDSSNRPVTIDLSNPYIMLDLGLQF